MTNRQPKGTPKGGEFAEGRKPEGGDLAHKMPVGFSVATLDDIGGGLVGTVTTTYADLVRVFGPPQFDDESDDRDKSTAEWWLKTPAGVVMIYDYDDEDERPLGEFAWHIGSASNDDVVFEIKKALGQTFGSHDSSHFDFGDGPVPAHQHANGGGMVANTATVDDTAFVGPDAKVCDNATVLGGARISGHSIISDSATVMDNALIIDSIVRDQATVAGEARATEAAVIRDSARVSGFATVSGFVDIYGMAEVNDYASVFDGATVGDEAHVGGYATLHGRHAHLYGPARVDGYENLDNVG